MSDVPLGLSEAYCAGCFYTWQHNVEKQPGYVTCTHQNARFFHVIWEREKGNCGPSGKFYEALTHTTPKGGEER